MSGACILISENYIISGIFLENRGPVKKVANRQAAIRQFSLLVFYPLIDTASCYTTALQIMPPTLSILQSHQSSGLSKYLIAS